MFSNFFGETSEQNQVSQDARNEDPVFELATNPGGGAASY